MPRWAPRRGDGDELVNLHKERLENYDPLDIRAVSTPSKGRNTHTASDFNAVYYFITVFKHCQAFFQNFFRFFAILTKNLPRKAAKGFQTWFYLFVCFYVLFFLQRKKSTKRSAAKGRNQGFSLWEPTSFHGARTRHSRVDCALYTAMPIVPSCRQACRPTRMVTAGLPMVGVLKTVGLS